MRIESNCQTGEITYFGHNDETLDSLEEMLLQSPPAGEDSANKEEAALPLE